MNISVITPFYKGTRYMQQLLGCIRAAALAAPEIAVELVLVNDSPECPISLEEDWIRGFSVRIIENEENGGIHRSRVNGLKEAKGEFILFLDQDDLLSEDAFSSQLALAHDADVILANGFDQNPASYGPIYKSLAHQRQAAKPRFYYSVGNQIVSPGQCLLRKSAIPEAWCTDFVEHNGSDDLLLWLLLFHSGSRWKVNERQIYTHVDTGENVSANVEKMAQSSYEVLELLKKHGCVTRKQQRQFLRSCRVLTQYMGRSKTEKILTMLCNPAAAAERMALMFYRKR